MHGARIETNINIWRRAPPSFPRCNLEGLHGRDGNHLQGSILKFLGHGTEGGKRENHGQRETENTKEPEQQGRPKIRGVVLCDRVGQRDQGKNDDNGQERKVRPEKLTAVECLPGFLDQDGAQEITESQHPAVNTPLLYKGRC